MSKRAIAAFLWFAATWVGYELLWSLTEVPRIAGPVIAFTVAALVTLDPLALFWPRAVHANGEPSRATARTGFDTPISPAG
jgi:sterol desaturase/sphingolipid hydroxylase (fatty acid hydroxylase superfamily)